MPPGQGPSSGRGGAYLLHWRTRSLLQEGQHPEEAGRIHPGSGLPHHPLVLGGKEWAGSPGWLEQRRAVLPTWMSAAGPPGLPACSGRCRGPWGARASAGAGGGQGVAAGSWFPGARGARLLLRRGPAGLQREHQGRHEWKLGSRWPGCAVARGPGGEMEAGGQVRAAAPGAHGGRGQ